MNKLDDFIDIFGLNIGKDEVREDKNRNKYKLCNEMETHQHRNDMSREEMEELLVEEKIIEDDMVEIDGVKYLEVGLFEDSNEDDDSNFDHYLGRVEFEDEENVVSMEFRMVDKQYLRFMEDNSFE